MRPIHQYSREGRYMCSYPSVKEAARCIGVSSACITECASSYAGSIGYARRCFCKGFIFTYEKKRTHPRKKRTPLPPMRGKALTAFYLKGHEARRVRVVVHYATGDVIYESITVTARELHTTPATICRRLWKSRRKRRKDIPDMEALLSNNNN